VPNSSIGYEKALLSFLPTANAESLSASAHIDHFNFILDNYGNNWGEIVALIGDTLSINQ
jgi:hypothetical protein